MRQICFINPQAQYRTPPPLARSIQEGVNTVRSTQRVGKQYANTCIMLFCTQTLKMLGLFVDTVTIRHKCCSMLSILNEFILQKEFLRHHDK